MLSVPLKAGLPQIIVSLGRQAPSTQGSYMDLCGNKYSYSPFYYEISITILSARCSASSLPIIANKKTVVNESLTNFSNGCIIGY